GAALALWRRRLTRGPGEYIFSSAEGESKNLFWGVRSMKRQSAIGFVLLALGLGLGGSWLGAQGQKATVILAGRLFDGKSDRLLSNQLIVIQDDRIAEVGPAGSITIPAGAQEIDLRNATVLPGLIEGHNHMFKIGDHPGAGADASVPLVIEPGTPFSDRKSTRLNSSHVSISYAVFCLKKK